MGDSYQYCRPHATKHIPGFCRIYSIYDLFGKFDTTACKMDFADIAGHVSICVWLSVWLCCPFTFQSGQWLIAQFHVPINILQISWCLACSIQLFRPLNLCCKLFVKLLFCWEFCLNTMQICCNRLYYVSTNRSSHYLHHPAYTMI